MLNTNIPPLNEKRILSLVDVLSKPKIGDLVKIQYLCCIDWMAHEEDEFFFREYVADCTVRKQGATSLFKENNIELPFGAEMQAEQLLVWLYLYREMYNNKSEVPDVNEFLKMAQEKEIEKPVFLEKNKGEKPFFALTERQIVDIVFESDSIVKHKILLPLNEKKQKRG